MKFALALMTFVLLIAACGGGSSSSTSNDKGTNPYSTAEKTPSGNPAYDPHRGEGPYNADNVKIGALDPAMAEAGHKIQQVKCASCHKLTDEKLVGPGWKGVTERRKPEWIMNFISNPDPMIDKDPAVQAQLELCLVRMPNQNLSGDEPRQVLEFMRQNDGVK